MRPASFFHLLLLFFALTLSAKASLDDWMEMEQKRIDRTVDESKIMAPSIGKQATAYRPDEGKWFDLPSVWVPESKLGVAFDEQSLPKNLGQEFVRVRGGQREFRLFIHPESRKFYEPFIKGYPIHNEHRATATASSRTLLVESKANPLHKAFVKVSLAVELGGVVRNVLRQETARAVGASAYIKALKEQLSDRFKIFDEPLGIIPKGWDQGGQLVRIIPQEILEKKTTPVPLFSLYAPNPDGVLLDKLAKRAGVTPAEFVDRFVNQPFAEGWANWAVKGSLVMEPHAQNVLLELGEDGLPTGKILLRDLGGVNIDAMSPSFDSRRKGLMPFIESFHADYLQAKRKDLHNWSLETYYEGGFLFNVENYLEKTDPTYVKGSISKKFWQQVSSEVKKVSGYEHFSPADLKENAHSVLTEARKAYVHRRAAENGPRSGTCWRWFHGLIGVPQ